MLNRSQRPFLHEEIMLLALRDEKGTVEPGSMYTYAIGGAMLAELLLAGRIAIEPSKKQLVTPVRSAPVDEPVLDECLARIVTAGRRASTQTWVQRFADLKNLHHRVAGGLCDRGILRADEQTVLLIFHHKVYPEIDPRPEREMIERLRRAIFGEAARVDPRTVILISLANSADLLSIPFRRRHLSTRKARVAQLTGGELLGKATAEAVQAAQAAVDIACMIPALAATSS